MPGAVWIPGTHVAMVPPTGFVAATEFAGFQDETGGTVIVVRELPAGPFNMSDAGLAREGFQVTTREETTPDGHLRVLVVGEQDAADGQGKIGRVYLSIGANDTSMLIISDYPVDDEDLRESVLAALRTTVFDPNRPIEPGTALGFSVTPASPLRLAGMLGLGAAYNTLGYLHPLDALIPTMHVWPTYEEAPPADPEALLREKLEGMRQQLFDPQVEEVSDVSISGLHGVEIVATAFDNLHDMHRRDLAYQVLLVDPDEDRYVHMSAVATDAARDDVLLAFRATAETFSFR